MKQDKAPENGGFHTLDLDKDFSFRGLHPLTPTGGRRKPPDPTFRSFEFPPFPSLKMVSDTSGNAHALGLIILIYLIPFFFFYIIRSLA